jgi:endonuclease-3 related protein
MPENKIEKLYKELKEKYGSPKGQWSLWCKRPKKEKERERVIIETILTQRTNWRNVEKAFLNLKKEKADSLKEILKIGIKKLEKLIKPSGFYKSKAQYLFGLAKFIIKNYGNLNNMKKENEDKLRNELLKLKGIGKESADSILLYALDKPVFVIDEYTRKIVKKKNLAKKFSYDFLQKLFEKNLKKDFRLYQDFHALIVIDGKNKSTLI